jgi:hypothetical protein
MTIVGFAGSVRKAASRGAGMALIPPSLTLILRMENQGVDGESDALTYFSVIFA